MRRWIQWKGQQQSDGNNADAGSDHCKNVSVWKEIDFPKSQTSLIWKHNFVQICVRTLFLKSGTSKSPKYEIQMQHQVRKDPNSSLESCKLPPSALEGNCSEWLWDLGRTKMKLWKYHIGADEKYNWPPKRDGSKWAIVRAFVTHNEDITRWRIVGRRVTRWCVVHFGTVTRPNLSKCS